MSTLLEVDPSACVFVVGPRLGACCYRHSHGAAEAGSRGIPSSYSAAVEAGIAALQERSGGACEEEHGRLCQGLRDAYENDPGLAAREVAEGLQRNGCYESWLKETFDATSSVGKCPSTHETAKYLSSLQGKGALLACTQYDTIIDDIAGTEPVCLEDEASFDQWLNGKPGFLHLCGVYSQPRTVRLDVTSLKSKYTQFSPRCFSNLVNVFKKKQVLFLGYEEKDVTPFLSKLVKAVFPDESSLRNPPILLVCCEGRGTTTVAMDTQELERQGFPSFLPLAISEEEEEKIERIMTRGPEKNFSIGKGLEKSLDGVKVQAFLLFDEKQSFRKLGDFIYQECKSGEIYVRRDALTVLFGERLLYGNLLTYGGSGLSQLWQLVVSEGSLLRQKGLVALGLRNAVIIWMGRKPAGLGDVTGINSVHTYASKKPSQGSSPVQDSPWSAASWTRVAPPSTNAATSSPSASFPGRLLRADFPMPLQEPSALPITAIPQASLPATAGVVISPKSALANLNSTSLPVSIDSSALFSASVSALSPLKQQVKVLAQLQQAQSAAVEEYRLHQLANLPLSPSLTAPWKRCIAIHPEILYDSPPYQACLKQPQNFQEHSVEYLDQLTMPDSWFYQQHLLEMKKLAGQLNSSVSDSESLLARIVVKHAENAKGDSCVRSGESETDLPRGNASGTVSVSIPRKHTQQNGPRSITAVLPTSVVNRVNPQAVTRLDHVITEQKPPVIPGQVKSHASTRPVPVTVGMQKPSQSSSDPSQTSALSGPLTIEVQPNVLPSTTLAQSPALPVPITIEVQPNAASGHVAPQTPSIPLACILVSPQAVASPSAAFPILLGSPVAGYQVISALPHPLVVGNPSVSTASPRTEQTEPAASATSRMDQQVRQPRCDAQGTPSSSRSLLPLHGPDHKQAYSSDSDCKGPQRSLKRPRQDSQNGSRFAAGFDKAPSSKKRRRSSSFTTLFPTPPTSDNAGKNSGNGFLQLQRSRSLQVVQGGGDPQPSAPTDPLMMRSASTGQLLEHNLAQDRGNLGDDESREGEGDLDTESTTSGIEEEERHAVASSGEGSSSVAPPLLAVPDVKGSLHLWEFLLHLLLTPNHGSIIQWTGNGYEFRLINSSAVAKLWGAYRRKPQMTYENLSRALRYYYTRGVIDRVPGRRLTYRFSFDVHKYVANNSSIVSALLPKAPVPE